jgi:ribonuclease D
MKPGLIRSKIGGIIRNPRRRPGKSARMIDPHSPPAKELIATLEPFVGLTRDQIEVVRNVAQAEAAVEVLMRAGTVGFDTESKPTFHKGQRSEGPHVLQFSTLERAFIFQTHFEEIIPAILILLKSPALTKIGFGLRGDLTQIADRFDLRPAALVDLDRSFHALGYRNAVGAKTAIAILFNRKLAKSKAITMSNWALPTLTDNQLLYAANDAYAAIRVHHGLRAL